MEAARRQGAPTVALTNDAWRRRWAAAADWTIALSAGPELAIAATKTYTTSLLAIAALSAALTRRRGGPCGRRGRARRDRRGPRSRAGDGRGARRAHAAASRALIVARGYEYATAREWAIKIKELAHVFADPYSAADFAHGPVALVEDGVPVIAIVRDGPAAAGLIEQLRLLRADLAPDLTVLSDRSDALALATRPIELPAGGC